MHYKSKIFKLLMTVALVICFIFSLSSCQKAAAGDDTEYFFTLDGRTAVYKDGMFMFDKGLLSFFSFDTEKIFPVCYKPNCLHDSEDYCPAIIPNASTIFVYNDKLYIFESEYVWDNKSGEATINTTIFASAVSGADKREVEVIKGCLVHSGVYVKDGKVYFTASELEFDETGSNTGYKEEYLCRYDQNTGGIEKLAKMSEGNNAYLSINGCYGERLVLEYSGTDDEPLNRKYSYYDPEKAEFDEIDGIVLRAQKDQIILKKGDALEVCSLDNAKPYVITDKRYVYPDWGGYVCVDGRLILSAEGIAMDLETQKEYKTVLCTLLARYDGKFLIRTPDQGYKFVSEQDFYSE